MNEEITSRFEINDVPEREEYLLDPEDLRPAPAPHPLAETIAEFLRLDKESKCPHLWQVAPERNAAVSDPILEPIREALRKKNWRQVHTMPGMPLADQSMAKLFGDSLESLEKTLGRLLLDAIISGDREFIQCVTKALNDADKLFHRNPVNVRFFYWHHRLPKEDFEKASLVELKARFDEEIGRQLSGSEWARITKEFRLEFRTKINLNTLKKRRGRKPKAPLGNGK